MGEYAVIDGAPGIVLAIDRGVRCDVWLGDDTVRLTTPDGDTRFVQPAMRHASPAHYRFSDWNPVDLPGKPGFGGSAAACVAACVAAGRPATDALAIHHRVQGSGSGVDVLASIHGGMGRTEDGRWHPVAPVIPVVTFAGRSAKTGPRVQQYRLWRGSAHARFVQESTELVDCFSDDPLRAFRSAWRLLVAMADAAGLEYRTEAIDHIVHTAQSLGGAAKPSGAGGGDCTVALFEDPDAAIRFQERLEAVGLPSIPVSPASGAHRVDA